MKQTTILLADPAVTVRSLVRTIFVGEGYVVIEATNTRDALDTLERVNPVLVIADFELPPDNPPASLIRACRTREIPIMILSRRIEPHIMRACFARGCGALLAKPVDASDLVAAVRSALRHATYMGSVFARHQA